MTDVSCSHQCTWPDCTQSEELREGIKRHEEMAAMASAEIADLTVELARLRAQEPRKDEFTLEQYEAEQEPQRLTE